MQVNMHEAKTRFSQLVARVERGEEIIIARDGKPVAKLVRLEPARKPRVFGRDVGLFEVPEDFDAPLPDDELKLFEGD